MAYLESLCVGLVSTSCSGADPPDQVIVGLQVSGLWESLRGARYAIGRPLQRACQAAHIDRVIVDGQHLTDDLHVRCRIHVHGQRGQGRRFKLIQADDVDQPMPVPERDRPRVHRRQDGLAERAWQSIRALKKAG